MGSSINIYESMAPAYWDVYDDIKAFGHSEYWFKGGRGSTKSSFISLAIIRGLLVDRNANAIVYRRVSNTLKDSVYAQMIWAINKLELGPLFRFRTSPYEIILKKTGQRILFRGADDPMKSKSIKLTHGYFKYLWFEELAEFSSMRVIRTIKQSIFRGVDKACTLYSYNPPKSAQSWVNEEALNTSKLRFTHHSTYLDVPPEWLGEEFIIEANDLKETNRMAYDNEYMGVVTGNGGMVFENVNVRPITQDEIDGLAWFYQGIDWGYFPDPFQWVRMGFDAKKRKLYIVDEFRANKLGNAETFDLLKDRLTPDEMLTADSAEPKSIADYRNYGANWIHAVKKGPGSVAYSIKWLASLGEIIIDEKCKHTAKEFVMYEYERNKDGEFVNGYPDANNHSIDAVRYAMYPVWRRNGE